MEKVIKRHEMALQTLAESIAQEVMDELPQMYELMHRIITRIKVQ